MKSTLKAPFCWYVLDKQHEPVPIDDIMTADHWLGDIRKRRVAETFVGSIRVSTVFLCLAANIDEQGRPMLFETMTFGAPGLGIESRYATWNDAKLGHLGVAVLATEFVKQARASGRGRAVAKATYIQRALGRFSGRKLRGRRRNRARMWKRRMAKWQATAYPETEG